MASVEVPNDYRRDVLYSLLSEYFKSTAYEQQNVQLLEYHSIIEPYLLLASLINDVNLAIPTRSLQLPRTPST